MIPKRALLQQIAKSQERNLREDISGLGRVVDQYGLGRRWNCRPAGDGLASKTYIITGDQGKWALKQYRTQIQPQAISFIHSLLIQLEKLSFPASRLRLTQDGLDYVTLDGYCYAMFEYVSGYHYDWYVMPKLLRQRHISQAGSALARFHLLTADMMLQGHRDQGYKTLESQERWDSYDNYSDEWFDLVTLGMRTVNNDWPIPDSISRKIGTRMVNLARNEFNRPLLPVSIIHGDYGPWNLLFRPFAKLNSVIDFDDVSVEERIEEVAASIIIFSAEKLVNKLDVEDGRVFLESYHQEYPLTLDELQALPRVLERYLLKRTLTILRRYLIFWRRVDHIKILNMIAWLDWLDDSGRQVFQQMTSSILESITPSEKQNEGTSIELV